MPPIPSTKDGVGRASSPLLGPDRAEEIGHQQIVEEAINSPFLLPEHRAIIGVAYSKFQLAEAGIMEAFLGFAKGFEVNIRNLLTHLPFINDLIRTSRCSQ